MKTTKRPQHPANLAKLSMYLMTNSVLAARFYMRMDGGTIRREIMGLGVRCSLLAAGMDGDCAIRMSHNLGAPYRLSAEYWEAVLVRQRAISMRTE